MINPARLVLKAWYELLNGNIVVNDEPVAVYRTDADSGEAGHYIIIRLESSSTRNNNHSFITNPVVIIDIVTRFDNKIDDVVAIDISTQVDQLVFPDPAHFGLLFDSDISVTSVIKQTETMLPEDNGATPKINRLISRYLHRVVTPADLPT